MSNDIQLVSSNTTGTEAALPQPSIVSSNWPSVSGDGRYVAFTSNATNLVDSPDINNQQAYHGVYVKDLVTGATTLASASGDGVPFSGGALDNVISEDGSTVVMQGSQDYSPAQIYAKNLSTGALTLISHTPDGQASNSEISAAPSVSSNGTVVAFESNADNLIASRTVNGGVWQIYVNNSITGATTLERNPV